MAGPSLGQYQNLSLQQTLAPQLQQSLQILQSPMLELRGLVQQELEINPVLEVDLKEPVDPSKNEDDGQFEDEFKELSRLDEEWREYLSQNSSFNGNDPEAEKRRQHMFDSHTGGLTLQQHLLEQAAMVNYTPLEREIAEHIIGNIDEGGFLQVGPEEMADDQRWDLEDVEAILQDIQTYDPPGIGARNLRETLLLQLERMGREDSLEYRVVDSCLDDLARKRIPQIARRLGAGVDQVQQAANFIAGLDPKPGSQFESSPNSYIIPDVLVEKVGDDYTVTLNNDYIPQLRISNTYKDIMGEGKARDVKSYIREKIRSGKFLIRSIHQRQETIHRIAEEIVARQREFFEHGPAHLKPMNMSQIAEIVGVHETTVSRAISGKYMQTPRGVYEMRYFFTTGYKTESGEDMSNTSVKNAIKDLVDNENPRKPLSDAAIEKQLKKRGIPVARRTIAKYRNELGILSSSMRRQY